MKRFNVAKEMRDAAERDGCLTRFENGTEAVSQNYRLGWEACTNAESLRFLKDNGHLVTKIKVLEKKVEELSQALLQIDRLSQGGG